MNGNIPVLILSAGESKRLGQPKALFNFNGKHWLEHQIVQLQSLNFKKITVVLGYFYSDINEKIDFASLNVAVVLGPNPELGQFSSLRQGLKNISSACFILPVDVPVPTKEVWQSLGAMTADVVQPTFEGRAGHPILISKKFCHKILNAPDDSRLDILVREEQNRMRIAVDDQKILMNLNTQNAFESFNKKSTDHT